MDMPPIGDGFPKSTVSGPVSAHFGTPPGRPPVAWARVLCPEIDLKWFGGAYALFPTLRRGPQSASPETPQLKIAAVVISGQESYTTLFLESFYVVLGKRWISNPEKRGIRLLASSGQVWL